MYGALADDPIERPEQLPLTERDSIDYSLKLEDQEET